MRPCLPRFSMFGTNPIKIRLLIAADQTAVTGEFLGLLQREYECEKAATLDDALARLRAREFSVVICDIDLGAEDDFDFLSFVSFTSPKTVVMMTGKNIDSEE